MEAALEAFLTTGVFAFLLSFVRLGTAMMLFPGIGDSFVSARIRLLAAFAITFVMLPMTMKVLPAAVPPTFELVMMVVLEFLVGLFLGTVVRIFMLATDTAGMVIANMSGLGAAQILNPSLATQGSLIGAFLSVTGVTLLFQTDMHHLLFMGLLESYERFPFQASPDIGSMAEFIARCVSASFEIGVKMASPFIALTLLIYAGMGVLSRVMPQIQVFMVALPLQILLSLILLSITLFAVLAYWVRAFEGAVVTMIGG